MGRINNKTDYPQDDNMNLSDYVIGTDYTSSATKTYTLDSIAGALGSPIPLADTTELEDYDGDSIASWVGNDLYRYDADAVSGDVVATGKGSGYWILINTPAVNGSQWILLEGSNSEAQAIFDTAITDGYRCFLWGNVTGQGGASRIHLDLASAETNFISIIKISGSSMFIGNSFTSGGVDTTSLSIIADSVRYVLNDTDLLAIYFINSSIDDVIHYNIGSTSPQLRYRTSSIGSLSSNNDNINDISLYFESSRAGFLNIDNATLVFNTSEGTYIGNLDIQISTATGTIRKGTFIAYVTAFTSNSINHAGKTLVADADWTLGTATTGKLKQITKTDA